MHKRNRKHAQHADRREYFILPLSSGQVREALTCHGTASVDRMKEMPPINKIQSGLWNMQLMKCQAVVLEKVAACFWPGVGIVFVFNAMVFDIGEVKHK